MASRIRDQYGVALPLGRVFANPTIANLATLIDELTREGALDSPTRHVAPIQRASRDGRLLPAPAQDRLWLLDQLASHSHNIHARLRLRGVLDREALERAVADLVAGHESLRTSFRVDETGRPQLSIAAAPSATPLEYDDLRNVGEQERQRVVRRTMDDELTREFDLAQGPLHAFRLLQETDTQHVMSVTLHHIIADGWSIGLLADELGRRYERHAAAADFPLESLDAQPEDGESNSPGVELDFPDFAQWQRSLLESGALGPQLEFWRTRLEGATPLDLPTDHPRRADVAAAPARVSFQLSSDLSQRIDGLSRRCNATPFMTLLAAYQLLLAKHAGQDDICVGVPVCREDPPGVGEYLWPIRQHGGSPL